MKKDSQNTLLKHTAANNSKERTKVTELKLITGGKDFTPTDTNWLINLKPNTVFTVKSKKDHSNFMLMSLQKIQPAFKTRAVRLWDPWGEKLFGDVDPVRFINFFDLYEVVEEPQEQEETEQKQE